ncbi:MAG: hypothetical protein HY909_29330 [Deltaproteobacteria bacterium]|nr:hypothetical protein [Deltaproteobacteria bacterium]
MDSKKERLLPWLPALAAAVAYLSALRSGWVWDDHRLIVQGRLIDDLRNLPAIFTHDASYNTDLGEAARRSHLVTYRPLPFALFTVERVLFGLRPAAFHAVSVLLHALNASLLARVGRRLGLPTEAWLGASVAFAVHTSTAEAVHWVNGVSDPLCMVFVLSALGAWCRPNPGDARGAPELLVAALAFSAALAKELVFVLAPPLLLLVWARSPGAPSERARRTLRASVPWATGLGVALLVRYLVLRRAAAGAGGTHYLYALARLPLLASDAVRALLVPSPRVLPSIHLAYRSPTLAGYAVAAGVLGLALALAVWQWRRARPLGLVALAQVVAAMAPITLLTWREGWSGWGRYLYGASALALLALAEAAVRALEALRPPLRRLAAAALVTLGVVTATQTFLAGDRWRSEGAWARAMIEDQPEAAFGHERLAAVLSGQGRDAEALVEARLAVRLNANAADAWAGYAWSLLAVGRREEAFRAAHRAASLDPLLNSARYLLALENLERGQLVPGGLLLLRVLATEPDQPGPWFTLQQLAFAVRDDPSAREALLRALEDPPLARIAVRARAILQGRVRVPPPRRQSGTLS